MLLLLLLLSHFSCVRLCATPQMAVQQAPLSLGFSRQEYWSGLPFPPPMHGSEKWKWSRSVMSDSFETPWTAAYQVPPSMGFSRQEYWSGVPLPSLEDMHRLYANIMSFYLRDLNIHIILVRRSWNYWEVTIHAKKWKLSLGKVYFIAFRRTQVVQ